MNGLALCSGYDGFGLGLSLAVEGYRTICHVEREIYAAAILAQRMEDGLIHQAPIWDDVTTFDGTSWCGKVDIITAGFPCQPWSAAGKQEGTSDSRWLWPSIARVIREVMPALVFLENVRGLVSGGGLSIVLRDLALLGYNAEWDLFRAEDVEAPHKRERVFILGYTSGNGLQCRRLEEFKPEDFNKRHAELGNAYSIRRAKRLLPKSIKKEDTLANGSGAFPPHPNDSEGWKSAKIKPAIHGMADGTAYRVDSIRACGNGVVPGVVALAFIKLMERAQCLT